MEIKRYIPEITTVGIAETVASVAVVKSAVEGTPQSANEIILLYGLATFYAGIPAALIVNVAKDLYLRHRGIGNQANK